MHFIDTVLLFDNTKQSSLCEEVAIQGNINSSKSNNAHVFTNVRSVSRNKEGTHKLYLEMFCVPLRTLQQSSSCYVSNIFFNNNTTMIQCLWQLLANIKIQPLRYDQSNVCNINNMGNIEQNQIPYESQRGWHRLTLPYNHVSKLVFVIYNISTILYAVYWNSQWKVFSFSV